MATIIEPPNYQSENQIVEYSTQSFGELTETDMTFSYSLDATEALVSVSLSVTPNPFDYGISIDGLRYHGHYLDYFEKALGVPLMLTLRDRRTLNIYQVNGFDNLPTDATTADCIEFMPPPPQSQVFSITCTLKYKTILPPAITDTITKTITQTLYGSATSWGSKIRDYIHASGPFPRVV